MKQRSVQIIAAFLARRRWGRIVQVRRIGDDDYIVAIDDVRDGRIQLLHSHGDLAYWLESFARGECVRPGAGICGRCDRLHVDRDVDGELLGNCIPCAGKLIEAGADVFLEDQARDDPEPPIR